MFRELRGATALERPCNNQLHDNPAIRQYHAGGRLIHEQRSRLV
jgi:hypothetical protein